MLLPLLLPPPQPHVAVLPGAGPARRQAHNGCDDPAAHRAGDSRGSPGVDALVAKGVPAGVDASRVGQLAQADGARLVPGGLLWLAHVACGCPGVEMDVRWGRLPWCQAVIGRLRSSARLLRVAGRTSPPRVSLAGPRCLACHRQDYSREKQEENFLAANRHELSRFDKVV